MKRESGSANTAAQTDPQPAAPDPPLGAALAEPPDKPHYHGHRDRLRQRFLDQGVEAVHDYELLELLLFAAIPRRDVKPLAKALMAGEGGLRGVVNAPAHQLRDRYGLSDPVVATLRVVGAMAVRMAKQAVINQPVLGSWQKVLDYCSTAMAHLPVEQFRILFLDRKNKLIADEVQAKGTVDHAPVYPREVVKRALDLHATAIILVHNHPSGDPTPSRADIEVTRQIVTAATALGVSVHDHLVIGNGKYISFKGTGLL